MKHAPNAGSIARFVDLPSMHCAATAMTVPHMLTALLILELKTLFKFLHEIFTCMSLDVGQYWCANWCDCIAND